MGVKRDLTSNESGGHIVLKPLSLDVSFRMEPENPHAEVDAVKFTEESLLPFGEEQVVREVETGGRVEQ